MTGFILGKIINSFKTEKGNEVVIRYPKREDLNELTKYINALSKEDTFMSFSGEVITIDEEKKILENMLKDIELGDKIVLCAFVNDKLIGVCNIDRNMRQRTRGLHVGIFGVSVAVDFRGEGISYKLAKTAIEEAKHKISGLKIITLIVFGANQIAINLYKKLGFKECGRLPDGLLYKGDYMDEVRMYLELD